MRQAADSVGDQVAPQRQGTAHAVAPFPDGDASYLPCPGQPANAAACSVAVLLIDDDPDFRSALCRYLRTNGFDTAEFDNFPTALALVRSVPGVFVIMAELTVGSRHLFDSIGQLRGADNVAVLVLCGHRDETDTIVALELGADDVIAKTADRREILARARAAARRLREPRPDVASAPSRDGSQGTMPGSWRFSSGQRRLIDPEGHPVQLTHAESTLLEAFVENVGKTLNRNDLSLRVLGRSSSQGDRGIDNLVAKLRRKLGDSARMGGMIRTARPIGYVFGGFRTTRSGGQKIESCPAFGDVAAL